MELLGRDADLGAQAKLAAVGKARAGVGIYGRGIDRIQEALAGVHVLGNDGLGMHGTVFVEGDDYVAATEEDWGREYLALEMSVKVVANEDEAIAHKNASATARSTSSDSAALHTPTRWVLALTIMLSALSKSADSCT